MIGLSFEAYTRDPADPVHYRNTVSGALGIRLFGANGKPVEDVLFEGNRLRFYKNNSINGADADHNRLRFRRNVFADNYSRKGHGQGLFIGGARDILLEDNLFDHNGWLLRADADADVGTAEGAATIFNHDTYFSTVDDTRFAGNSFHRPSSIGTKWTANEGERSSVGIEIRDNLYNDCEIGISAGGNIPGPYRFADMTVVGNVITDLGRSRQTDRALGWGIDMNDWDGGRCDSNLVIQVRNDTVGNAYGISFRGGLRDVHVRANTVADLGRGYGLYFEGATGERVRVGGNALALDDDREAFFGGSGLPLDYDFDGNTYAAPTGSGDLRFRGGASYSLDEWLELSGERPASLERPEFRDDTRSLDRYITEVLGLADRAAFYAALRTFSREHWDERYGARAINDYLREGYSVTAAPLSLDGEGDTGGDLPPEAEASVALRIFPNPTTAEVTLADARLGAWVLVHDAFGRRVRDEHLGHGGRLSLRGLPPGWYVVTARAGGSSRVGRVLLRP